MIWRSYLGENKLHFSTLWTVYKYHMVLPLSYSLLYEKYWRKTLVSNSGIEILISFYLKKNRQIIDQGIDMIPKSVRKILLNDVFSGGIKIQYPISISYFNILFWYIPVTKEKIRENDTFSQNWRNFTFSLIWRENCILVSKIPYSTLF